MPRMTKSGERAVETSNPREIQRMKAEGYKAEVARTDATKAADKPTGETAGKKAADKPHG